MTGTSFFLEALKTHARMFHAGAAAGTEADPEISAWLLDPLADWAVKAYGPEIGKDAAKGYAAYAFHVAQSQRTYEDFGTFQGLDLAEIKGSVYDEPGYMIPYMWAAILIYAFWPSMTEHLRLYRDTFLPALPKNATLVELACGHGVLGLLALRERPDIHVEAQDISPPAISVAETLAKAAGLENRIRFEVGDALSTTDHDKVDGVLAAMLAEHLPEPRLMFEAVASRLKPTGTAFIGAALESAQKDHIHEFHRESELILLAENAGLRVKRLISDTSANLPPGARFNPRALAMVLEHA
jgi:hypothetical protein